MKKVVLFDGDGVVIRGELFGVYFQREYNVPAAEMLPFYQGIFQDCLAGKADLKKVLPPWLEKWGWQGTVDEFVQAWFEYENHVDEQMIELIRTLREKAIKCYLATNQEKYRAAFLKNEMDFEQIFDGVFSSSDIGAKKPDPQFYESVCSALEQAGIARDEIVYTDDTAVNIERAKALGIESFLFKECSEFQKYLQQFTEFELEHKTERSIS